jgi:hypothetical protein
MNAKLSTNEQYIQIHKVDLTPFFPLEHEQKALYLNAISGQFCLHY